MRYVSAPSAALGGETIVSPPPLARERPLHSEGLVASVPSADASRVAHLCRPALLRAAGEHERTRGLGPRHARQDARRPPTADPGRPSDRPPDAGDHLAAHERRPSTALPPTSGVTEQGARQVGRAQRHARPPRPPATPARPTPLTQAGASRRRRGTGRTSSCAPTTARAAARRGARPRRCGPRPIPPHAADTPEGGRPLRARSCSHHTRATRPTPLDCVAHARSAPR